jgi:hypothetical protein
MANIIPPDTWLSLGAAPDDESRATIANAILEDILRSTNGIDEVAEQLSSESTSVRLWAAWILDESGRRVQQVPRNVLAGIDDPNPSVRALCSQCLFWLEDEWLLPSICALLVHLDDEFLVSVRAARVLFLKLNKERHSRRWLSFPSDLGKCIESDSRLSRDLTEIRDAIAHSQSCERSLLGVQSQSQRVSLTWAVGAALAAPPSVCALFEALRSRHTAVSVLAAERLSAIIESRSMNEGYTYEFHGRDPRTVALRRLGEKIIESGGRDTSSVG